VRIVAFIPAKGNSRRLKGKNIYPLKEKPLICWTLDAIKQSKYLNETYISTNSEEIANISLLYGFNVIHRPDSLALESVGKQQVLEHALSEIEKSGKVDYICMLQANSPQIEACKIDEAIEKVAHSNGEVWECLSINKETLFTDGAIRVFNTDCVSRLGLGMYISAVLTDYIDVHTIEDINTLEKMDF
tara:strand:+ start:25228 stop:25791 length:564 start_codon:yes stop_codon:yes gene_type:complete